LNYLGREGIDFKMEGDKVVSLRQIDPATGLPVPFNADPNKKVADFSTPFICGAMADSRINDLNPAYSDYAKETVAKYWSLRKSASNLAVIPFDMARSAFTGDYYAKSTLKPVEAIYKIVYESKSVDDVGPAWQKWLDDNAQQINNILTELNANLVK